MQQPVALLDVDHTLLFSLEHSFNEALAMSLLDHGITRVYLFTDMTLHDPAIKDRNNLVKRLEQIGFAVQGVITPSDVTWFTIPAEEVDLLGTMCFSGKDYTGKLYGQEFEDFIVSRSSVLPQASQAIRTYHPMKCVLGEGFNEASVEYCHTGRVSEAKKNKSVFAKVFADHLSEKLGYKHNKGLLLDVFLRHRPAWASSIVVCDDHQDVIYDVENFRPVPASSVSLDPPETPTSSATAEIVDSDSAGAGAGAGVGGDSSAEEGKEEEWLEVPPITMIPVTSLSLPARYYNDLLDLHMQKVI